MSLYSAMQSAVSALGAQSQALAMISDNIANASTTGYKTTTASFSSFVTQANNATQYSAGGVSVTGTQNITQYGLIEATSSATDLAIDGDGFFVVTDANGDYFYTRDGEFDIDDDGYLVTTDGYYLMGYGLDADGNIIGGNTNDLSSLQRINVYDVTGTAAATENVELTAILPADAAIGDVFTTNVEVYDSLGVAQNLEMTWEKTAANEWSLMVGDPTSPGDSAVTTGTTTGGPFTVTFNGDGTLDTITPAAEISVTGWTSGANDSTIAFDLGTSGGTDGLSQYGSDDDSSLSVELRGVDQDGARFGQWTGVEFGTDGTVTVNFDNDESLAVFEIPLATFPNANGLNAQSGNVYAATMESGAYLLSKASTSGTGSISPGSLEASTVDIADEFTRMIVAQQAYSSASRVITTTNEMMDELTNMVR